ncbi:MAG: hypothetical protein OXH12_12165 [Chloroflexi bacterium]|nr:hypothetical protein [Chloroflexota bacterium]
MHRVLGGLVAALVLALAASCGGGEPPPAPIRALEATAERAYLDDLPQASSVVRVRFNRAVEPTKLRALNAAFRLTAPEGSPLTGHPLTEMPVEGVELISSRVVELTVGALIVSGSTLHVSTEALSGPDDEVSVVVTSEFTELGVVLAGGVFAFGDFSLVEQRDPEAPTASDRDPFVVRAALEEHLNERAASAAVRETALFLYDGMDPEVVAAPKLRAALAALAGTFADAAVRSLLGPDNCTGASAAFIGFQEPPGDLDLVARVTYDDEGRRIVSIRPDLEAAPFELLMPLLAHEAVHCDQQDSLTEEIVASAIDVFLYIHLLISQPELARDASPLARNFNIEALAMLNSGRAIPESLGILPSPHGREVLPDSGVAYGSFVDAIAATYADDVDATAPVEPVAQQYLDALAQAVGAPLGSAIDLNYVDLLIGRATTFEAISNLLDLFDLAPG